MSAATVRVRVAPSARRASAAWMVVGAAVALATLSLLLPWALAFLVPTLVLFEDPRS